MCESVEKYAKAYGDKRAENAANSANVNAVKKLMLEMKMTLEQALDFLALDSKQRSLVTKQLQQ